MSEQFEQACWFECEDVIFMVLMKKKKTRKRDQFEVVSF